MYAIFDDISVALRHCTLCSYIDELVFVFITDLQIFSLLASKSFSTKYKLSQKAELIYTKHNKCVILNK